KAFAQMPLFFPPLNAKFAQLIMIALVAIGSKPKKNQEIHIGKSIVVPMLIGGMMMFGSLLFLDDTFDPEALRPVPYLNIWQMLYLGLSFFGVLILMVGADNISKIIKDGLGKDRWNIEQESFDQNRELIETDYSINI